MIKKIIIVIIVIVIVGGIFWFAKFKDLSKIEYATQIAQIGTLTQSVEATGKVESIDRIELNFRTTGRINEMKVSVGDSVKQGEVLTRLDNRVLISKLSDAQAQVDKEKADYNKLLAGASAEDIQVTEDTVSQKEQDVITTENALASLELKKATELRNLKEKVITTLNSEIIVAQSAVEVIDNTLNDPDASSTLGVLDSNTVVISQSSRDEADNKNDSVSNALDYLSINSLDSHILNASNELKTAVNLTRSALSDAMDVLLNTITSSYLSETELDTLKTNIQAQQTKINISQTNIVVAKTNWTDKIVYYDEQIASAKDAIDQAKTALVVAKSQLGLKKSPPRQFEIDAQKAKLAQAESRVSLALANLEEATIRAPINGTITKKYNEAGEQTSLASPVLEMIGNAILEIEVDIPESDISKVEVGQIAMITLDAFGDEKEYAGSVVFVDPAETLISDVVYYKVKVAFSDSGQVKPGMTANITIIIDEKPDALFVPFRAVKSRNGDKYVEILENGLSVERIVKTGLRGDEGIEIVSGIEPGDEVITFVKEK